MKRNPLYIAIRRNALMSAGALALGAGGAITAITMAQASTTITYSTGPGFDTVNATADGFFDTEDQSNVSGNTLEAIVSNNNDTIVPVGTSPSSDLTTSVTASTIDATADGNVQARDVSLSSRTGTEAVIAAFAVGQVNDNVTVNVQADTNQIGTSPNNLVSGTQSVADSLIRARARLNVSGSSMSDLPATGYTSTTGPASLSQTGNTTSTSGSATLSTVQINKTITTANTAAAEATNNTIQLNTDMDEANPGFADTLSLTGSTIEAGIIGNSADGTIDFTSVDSLSASTGVSNVQENQTAALNSLNSGSNVQLILTERDDVPGDIIASLTGTAELSGAEISATSVGSSATTLNNISATGGINNPAGSAGVSLDSGADSYTTNAGFAGLNVQSIDAASTVNATTTGGSVAMTIDEVNTGGTASLADADSSAVAVGNEIGNTVSLSAVGVIGGSEASLAIGSSQSNAAATTAQNTNTTISSIVGGGDVASALTGGGTLSLDNGDIRAAATGNTGTNSLSADGDRLALQPTGASVGALGQVNLAAGTLASSAAAGATLLSQQTQSGAVTSAVDTGVVAIDAGNAASTTGLDGTVTLTNSDITSRASGNAVGNTLDLDSSSSMAATASVGNTQVASSSVTATLDGDISLSGGNATSIAGTFTVSDNSLEGAATSNIATNLATLDAANAFNGQDVSTAVGAGNNAVIGGGTLGAAAGVTLANAQSAATTTAQPDSATANLRIATDLTSTLVLDGVTSTTEANSIAMSADGNTANNAIEITGASINEANADNSTLAALASGQQAGATTATGAGLVSTTATGATLDGTTTLSLVDNAISAASQGNVAGNTVTLTATDGISSTGLRQGAAITGAAAQSADGGVALLSSQASTGSSASLDAAGVAESTLGVTLDVTGDMSTDDELIGSLAGNTLSADARGNFADNAIELDGASLVNTSAALTSAQSASAVAANVQTPTLSINANSAFAADTQTTLSITGATPDANGFTPREMEALALANTALNSLSATGTSGITASTTGNDTATADIGTTESAVADHALINSQITNDGNDVTANLVDPTIRIDLNGIAAATVNEATLKIADQTLLALARGNYAESDIGLTSTSGVASTQALTSTQEANSDNLTANATGVSIGIDAVNTNGFDSNSVLTATDNTAGATVLGNVGGNQVVVDAGSISGGTGNASANTTANTAAGANTLSSSQEIASTALAQTLGATTSGTVALSNAAIALDDTTLEASGNRFDSLTRGNDVSNEVDMRATDDSEANAALTSDQRVGGFAGPNLTATTTGSVTVAASDMGATTGSTVDISDNFATADILANFANNTLGVDAAGIAAGTGNAIAAASGTATGGLVLGNRQEVANTATSLTSQATGTFTVTSADDIDNSTVTVAENITSSAARGSVASNAIDVASTGTSTASSALGSDQLLSGNLSSTATGTASITYADESDGISTLGVTDNQVLSQLLGNRVDNDLLVNATSIAAGSGLTSNAAAPGGANAGMALGNRQQATLETTSTSNAIGTFRIAGGEIGGDGDTDPTTAEISGNVVRSQVDVNSAGNSGFTADQQRQDIAGTGNDLSLSSTGAVTANSALSSRQQVIAGTAAGLTTAATGIFDIDATFDLETGGTTAVNSDNTVQALMRGNNALNNLNVDAGSIAAGASLAGGIGRAVVDGSNDRAQAGLALSNRQEFDSASTGLKVSTTATSDVTIDAQDIEVGSVASANGNLAWSQSALNRGISSLDLDAVNGIAASAALTNEQVVGNTGSVDTTTNADVLVSTSLTLQEGTAISLTGNQGVATASSNLATNTLNVDSVAALTSPLATPLASNVSVNAALTTTEAQGDYALTSRQSNAAALNTLVGNDNNANTNDMTGIEVSVGTNATETAMSVDSNTLWADSLANSVTNSLLLNGSGVGTSAGIANVQSNDASANISSVVGNYDSAGAPTFRAGPSIRADITGDMTDSAVSLAGNQIRATATANDAGNTLSAESLNGVNAAGTSGTAISNGTGVSVSGAGLSVLNAQQNDADVVSAVYSSEISFSTDTYTNGTGGSAVALNGNTIAAASTGNSAVNQARVNGIGDASTPVGVANRQVNNGNNLSSTVNGASVSATLGGGSGSMVVSSRNNTISATTQGNVSGNSVSTNNALSRAGARLNR